MHCTLPSLVLIARAVFVLERGHTDTKSHATDRPTRAWAIPPASAISGRNEGLAHDDAKLSKKNPECMWEWSCGI